MYRKALCVSVILREALAHGKCCNSVGAGKDFPGVLLAVVLLLLAVREASAASDVWSPLTRSSKFIPPSAKHAATRLHRITVTTKAGSENGQSEGPFFF